MAKELSDSERAEIKAFSKQAQGLEQRRRHILAEAHRRAEIDLHHYRESVFIQLEELRKKYSISQIIRHSGMARSTVYRWTERARQQRMSEELAALQGVPPTVESISSFLSGSDAEALGIQAHGPWANAKRMFSGEVSATDTSGDVWIFDGTEAWNKTKDVVIRGVDEWPAGAKSVIDGLA